MMMVMMMLLLLLLWYRMGWECCGRGSRDIHVSVNNIFEPAAGWLRALDRIIPILCG